MMARTTRDDLIELLQDWTYAAARMSQGLDVSATGAVGGSPDAPPDDTGEALGTEIIRYGQRVTLIALPAPPLFLTPKGLEQVGPPAFGYQIPFRSVF